MIREGGVRRKGGARRKGRETEERERGRGEEGQKRRIRGEGGRDVGRMTGCVRVEAWGEFTGCWRSGQVGRGAEDRDPYPPSLRAASTSGYESALVIDQPHHTAARRWFLYAAPKGGDGQGGGGGGGVEGQPGRGELTRRPACSLHSPLCGMCIFALQASPATRFPPPPPPSHMSSPLLSTHPLPPPSTLNFRIQTAPTPAPLPLPQPSSPPPPPLHLSHSGVDGCEWSAPAQLPSRSHALDAKPARATC